MKRMICWLMVVLMVVPVFGIGVFAADTNTICFDDGSYIIIDISAVQGRASGTVTGNKTYTYHDSDGTIAWKAVLRGTFSYTGSSASCTASNCNITIYDSAWYTVSKSAAKSGNTATASVTMGKKVLGVTVNKVPISMSLSCDANGNLN